LQLRDNALTANGLPPMGDLTAALDLAPSAIDGNFSGSWYDHTQSGQGINVEVLPNNQMLAYWYVYDSAGNQAWIFGTGPITGNSATITAARGLGAKFPPNFNTGDVQTQNWGTLNISFDSCSSGTMSWTTSVAGFSNGSMPLERLTQPAGTSCQ